MKSISHGTVSSPHQVGDEEHGALQDADEEQVAALVVGRDLGARARRCGSAARPPRSGSRRRPAVDVVASRVLPRRASPRPPSRAPRRSPGTATTSSPRTTIGQPSRSARGTLASTRRSCTFLRLPASRSPGRRDRTTRPSRSVESRHGPQSTAPSSRSVSYSRTARMPAPRSAASSRPGDERSSTQRRLERRGSRGRSSASASRLRFGAAGRARRRSGRISSRIRPRFVSRVRRVDRVRQAVLARSRPRSPRARAASSGRTTPSSRRALIPRVEPLATSR